MGTRWLLSFSLLLLTSRILPAQVTSTSTLSGTVVDSSSAVVPGAAVSVTNMETGADFHVVTAATGSFTVPSLPAGRYLATVTAKGFKEARVSDIVLEVGIPTN